MKDLIKRERERIARELHDRLGQTLTYLKLDVAWIKRRMRDGAAAAPVIEQRLEDIMAALDTSVDEVRNITYALRTAELQPGELKETLESHVRAMAEKSGLSAFCDIAGALPIDSNQALQIFLIAQEAMTNILRHSKAGTVWVSLETGNTGIDLRVRDDGTGMASSSGTTPRDNLGLTGMSERARSIGATLRVGPSPQGGTLVHLHLPAAPDLNSPRDLPPQHKGA